VNLQELCDDARGSQTLRAMRWPDGVTCPRCASGSVLKNGRDDSEPDRQRAECRDCQQRFDDLTDTIFAGHHQPLRTWIAGLSLRGLNLSGLPIAPALDLIKETPGRGSGRFARGASSVAPRWSWRRRSSVNLQ
jgi:hypothetical protein